jgi:hypothetical protein
VLVNGERQGANHVLGVPQSLGLTPLHFACMALGNEAAMVLLEHAGPTAIAHVDDLGRSCLAVTSTIDGGVMKAKLADIAAQAGVIVPASPKSPTSEEESVDGHRVRDTRPVMRSKGASTVDKLPVCPSGCVVWCFRVPGMAHCRGVYAVISVSLFQGL